MAERGRDESEYPRERRREQEKRAVTTHNSAAARQNVELRGVRSGRQPRCNSSASTAALQTAYKYRIMFDVT